MRILGRQRKSSFVSDLPQVKHHRISWEYGGSYPVQMSDLEHRGSWSVSDAEVLQVNGDS